jgi:Protein of unknown function (DUF3500)
MPHDGWHPDDHDHSHGQQHGPPRRRLILAAATFLPFGGASAQTVDAAQRIADAANRFLGLLDDGQRRKALIAFESDNRLDWHYIPRSRSGLTLGEMTPVQAEAARALFATVLNEQGLKLLDGVRLVEGVLREQQGSFRDPGRYYLSVFGTPGRLPWGWRAEIALALRARHDLAERAIAPRGLELAIMDAPARQRVEALMDRFLATLAPDLLAAQKRRVMEQGLDHFRFAWAGWLAPGEAYYFRVHGPVTLIEHDNTQNNANHVHSVWRDLAADFGHDALAEHYRQQPHR